MEQHRELRRRILFCQRERNLTCPPSSGIPCIYQGGTNGTIWSNIANYSGGGIYFTSLVTPTISGVRINYNRTLINDGGGIWVGSTSAPVMILGNDISQNTATGNGGGVYGFFPENLQLSTNFIMTNTGNLGGGVALEGAGGVIRNNFLIATRPGPPMTGGMSVTGFSNVTIEGNWFERNISADQAGGIYLGTTGDALVNANSFFTNTAHTGGGALTNSTGNVTFTNNIAARNTTTSTIGSGFYINSYSVPFNNNTIANNTGDGVTFVGATGIQLYNNIVYSNTGVGLNHLDGFTYRQITMMWQPTARTVCLSSLARTTWRSIRS
jgi:hypothetical protein